MLDLASLDILVGSNQGRWFNPLHPATGRPIEIGKAADGKTPVYFGFKLLGRHSDVVRDALRRIADQRALMEGEGRILGEAEAVRMNAEFLAHACRAWTPIMENGQELPFTFDNAVRLFSDPRFRWIEPQLRNFVMTDGNFMPA